MPGLELASIVTAGHADEARAAHPGAEVRASAGDLFAASDEHDIVVVAAPNRHHASLALDTSVKFMVTGAVLLAAVVIDAIARRQRQAAGRV